MYKHRRQGAGRIDPRNLMSAEQKRESERQRVYFLGEQQLIEDVQTTLQCSESEVLKDKVTIIKQSGSVLLREGLRLLLREEHRNDIQSFINSYKLLAEVVKIGDDWLENSLKFVIMGVKDPLVFLCQCIEKLQLIEESKKADLRSFKILSKYKARQMPPAHIINTIQQHNENLVKRRKSNVVDPAHMQSMLRKSAVTLYIREKLSSYFKEPTKFEQAQTFLRQSTQELNSKARDAVKTTMHLVERFAPHEMNLPQDIIEELSEGSSFE